MSGWYPFCVEADRNTGVPRISFKHHLLPLTVGNAQRVCFGVIADTQSMEFL